MEAKIKLQEGTGGGKKKKKVVKRKKRKIIVPNGPTDADVFDS